MTNVGNQGFCDAFRYYTRQRYGSDYDDNGMTGSNIMNIFGYFPLVGCFTAITRWNAIYNERNIKEDERSSLGLRIGQAVRGIFEFLGLGLVVGLLLDLPVALYDHCDCLRASTQSAVEL